MSSRQERIEIFEGTRRLCLHNPFLQNAIAASKAGQRIYWEGETIEYGAPRFAEPAAMRLSPKKTVEAAMPYARAGKRTCILNFASSVNPGGGVQHGSSAQEESLCRCSTLFPTLDRRWLWQKYYDVNRLPMMCGIRMLVFTLRVLSFAKRTRAFRLE